MQHRQMNYQQFVKTLQRAIRTLMKLISKINYPGILIWYQYYLNTKIIAIITVRRNSLQAVFLQLF